MQQHGSNRLLKGLFICFLMWLKLHDSLMGENKWRYIFYNLLQLKLSLDFTDIRKYAGNNSNYQSVLFHQFHNKHITSGMYLPQLTLNSVNWHLFYFGNFSFLIELFLSSQKSKLRDLCVSDIDRSTWTSEYWQ